MPFIKRTVEPVKIRQGALEKSDISLGEEHEVIVNKCYTQILLQLSQLAVYANEIFTDLSQECKTIIDKSQRLKTRVWELDQTVKELNVLEEPLPESTLDKVGTLVRTTPVSQPYQENSLFTVSTRPDSVQRFYDQADTTPRAVFAALGPVGWKAAKNFCLTPIYKEAGPTTVTLIKHEKTPYKIKYERDAKLRAPRPRFKATRPQSCAATLDHRLLSSKSVLPTPEETVLRSVKSQPSILVPIDTSLSNFERFAQSRASLRNLQLNKQKLEGRSEVFNRPDPRRQTISGPADLRRSACLCNSLVSTEELLDPGPHQVTKLKSTKPKNPDLYIEDTSDLFVRNSRSKERKPSVLLKLVQRSRSLPRNLGRSKSKEMIVAPDFYEIHPQKSLSILNNGAQIDIGSNRIYTNFYGAPNTELPSPELANKLTKSKSDCQINERLRSKSQSAMEEVKCKEKLVKRPRSVSAERNISVRDNDDKKFHSLSRTFTGLFGRNRKSKSTTTTSYSKAHSRDSLNTVFTSSSDGDTNRRNTRRITNSSNLPSHLTFRKRDSKATTSSSGRWSGSERFSLDSDGLFSSTSQNRLSRASGDQDSALGADINETRLSPDNDGQGDGRSLYSVDDDGFYTTMHTDSCLYQGPTSKKDSLADLSLETSSTCTSTKTLNDVEKTTPDIRNSSISSFSDSDRPEEISQRVQNKVNAGHNINRYSLVVVDADLDDESDKLSDIDSIQSDSKITLKQSKTYESQLDLVLEEMSDAETATIHSDADSVKGITQCETTPQRNPAKPENINSTKSDSNPVNMEKLNTSRTESKNDSTVCNEDEKNSISHYRQINGSSKYQILPSKVTCFDSTEDSNDRTYLSLPRNVRNLIPKDTNSNTMELTGSLPRRLSKNGVTDGAAELKQATYSKRRSLSPGKIKGQSTPVPNEKIHSLIEEARRMSSVKKANDNDSQLKSSNSRPLSQPVTVSADISPHSNLVTNQDSTLVSPYASFNVADSPPENFIRQPSYKLACKNSGTPTKRLPRSHSEDISRMRRNYSYRRANSQRTIKSQLSESIAESNDSQLDTVNNDSTIYHGNGMRHSMSFDRVSRAPSYRKALEPASLSSRDSGIGLASADLTSSSDSNRSEGNIRVSSYRLATESNNSDNIPVLNQTAIRDCMKGVYENEETHLSTPSITNSEPEVIKINTGNSYHHVIPRTTVQPTSFNPSYQSTDYVPQVKQAHKKYLQPSRSAPNTKSNKNIVKILTPPARIAQRKDRPLSSYIPNDTDEIDSVVPDNKLMLPKYNQSAFTSMEMLKREEMAVMSILGKIRQSTRPLSFVQTDI